MRQMNRLFFLAATASLAACSSSGYALTPTSEIPAAVGTVKTSEGENGNTRIHLEVRHLAAAARVAPGATTWVVWTRAMTGNPVPQNAGALQLVNEEGHLDTISPLHAFQIFLTAEASAQVSAPTGKEMLLTNVGAH